MWEDAVRRRGNIKVDLFSFHFFSIIYLPPPAKTLKHWSRINNKEENHEL